MAIAVDPNRDRVELMWIVEKTVKGGHQSSVWCVQILYTRVAVGIAVRAPGRAVLLQVHRVVRDASDRAVLRRGGCERLSRYIHAAAVGRAQPPVAAAGIIVS